MTQWPLSRFSKPASVLACSACPKHSQFIYLNSLPIYRIFSQPSHSSSRPPLGVLAFNSRRYQWFLPADIVSHRIIVIQTLHTESPTRHHRRSPPGAAERHGLDSSIVTPGHPPTFSSTHTLFHLPYLTFGTFSTTSGGFHDQRALRTRHEHRVLTAARPPVSSTTAICVCTRVR